jgi:two-component system LytT family response regulator
MPLRILLVDDEPVVRRDLARLLGAEVGVEVVGGARNGIEALEQIDRLVPDAVFLDVQMPELDGLGVVAALDPRTAPVLVFVTAFDRYALQAFDAAAVDYLLKPFDAARCRRAVERVRTRVSGSRSGVDARHAVSALQQLGGSTPRYLERVAVRMARRIVVIDVADVHWVDAADNYVRLHTPAGSYLARRTMREMAELLNPIRFVRIHRSAIVNVGQVSEVAPRGDADYVVTLHSGVRLALSRSYRARFVAAMGGVR